MDASQYARLDFVQTATQARAGSQDVPAAAEAAADDAHVDRRRFGAQADPHQAFGQFLEEGRHLHGVDAADVVDQAFVVVRLRSDGVGGMQ